MFTAKWNRLAVALVVTGQMGIVTPPSTAGQFSDWLFGGPTQTIEPVVAFYPPGVGSQISTPVGTPGSVISSTPTITRFGSATACCTPSVACPSPVVCCPPAVVCYPTPAPARHGLGSIFAPRSTPGLGSAPRVSPIPQTYYRTTWKRVPVTAYRPATTADPITGCPVTVMQPCTTYRWEPERRRCGLLGRLFGLCDPAPPAMVATAVPTCVVTSDCCGPMVGMESSTILSPSPTPAGYYAPGGSALGQGFAPPATAVPTPSLAPPTDSPGQPGPADLRPSLKPADGGLDSYYLAPQDGPSGPQWSGPYGNGAESDPTGTVPLPALEGPAEKTHPGSLQLRPVPDPDATPVPPRPNNATPHGPLPNGPLPNGPLPNGAAPSGSDSNDAPQLLNPRDQVAAANARPAWAYTATTWPKPETRQRASAQSPSIPVRQPASQWDESGWQSLRP
jgi:hypothetical protein